MAIPIQFQFNSYSNDDNFNSNYGNSNSIPIAELELAINSNPGAELTPALMWYQVYCPIVWAYSGISFFGIGT